MDRRRAWDKKTTSDLPQGMVVGLESTGQSDQGRSVDGTKKSVGVRAQRHPGWETWMHSLG